MHTKRNSPIIPLEMVYYTLLYSLSRQFSSLALVVLFVAFHARSDGHFFAIYALAYANIIASIMNVAFVGLFCGDALSFGRRWALSLVSSIFFAPVGLSLSFYIIDELSHSFGISFIRMAFIYTIAVFIINTVVDELAKSFFAGPFLDEESRSFLTKVEAVRWAVGTLVYFGVRTLHLGLLWAVYGETFASLMLWIFSGMVAGVVFKCSQSVVVLIALRATRYEEDPGVRRLPFELG